MDFWSRNAGKLSVGVIETLQSLSGLKQKGPAAEGCGEARRWTSHSS